MPLTALQEGSGTVLKGKVTLVDWGPNGSSVGLRGRVGESSMKGDDGKENTPAGKEQGSARRTFHVSYRGTVINLAVPTV